MVIADPKLVSNVDTAAPWRAVPGALTKSSVSSRPSTRPTLQTQLIEHFLTLRHSACYSVGMFANELLALADTHGLNHPDVITLGMQLN